MDSTRTGLAYSSRHGAAHRAVTLDLMLRTFMNSPDFQPHNPRMWEGIARLVPGTTPHQCIQRWEELCSSSRQITRDLSVLSAKGRPLSAHHEQHMNNNSSCTLRKHHVQEQYQNVSSPLHELPPICTTETRSHKPTCIYDHYRGSMISTSGYRLQSGRFAASFCQSHLYGSKRKYEKEDEEEEEVCKESESIKSEDEEKTERKQNTNDQDLYESEEHPFTVSTSGTSTALSKSTSSTLSTPTHENDTTSHMSIRVQDEAKKMTKDFTCPRDVLIKEMCYFNDYLSSPESKQWEEVDISVRCDVSVFHWLMSYAKRGLKEGPCGETLDTPLKPPQLESSNAISILISSDFLKMDALVEECITYCYTHISEIVAAPCNMSCIGNHLLSRLAQHFSPLEVEEINDHKDKIKSKLYLHLLERLFDKSFTHPQCPVNATTLFRCMHCECILTQEQQKIFPCSIKRLKVDKNGKLIHKHERDPRWDINQYIISLLQSDMTWRDIFWRIWGTINWLFCSTCNQPFQCKNLTTCLYHSNTIIYVDSTGIRIPGGKYSCCGNLASSFSPLTNIQSGCCLKDHAINASNSSVVSKIATQMKELMCKNQEMNILSQDTSSLTCVLSNEQRINNHHITTEVHPKGVKPRLQNKDASCDINTQISIGIDKGCISSPSKYQESHDKSHDETRESRNKATKFVHSRRARQVVEDEESSSDNNSSSSSELEEDEEDGETKRKAPKIVRGNVQKKTIGTNRKSRVICRQGSSENTVCNYIKTHQQEWEWDCSKTVRWNQDMQRANDEKKINQIERELQHMTVNTKNQKSIGSSQNKTDSTSYAGGIFSRIEAQFRAQRTAAHSGKLNYSTGCRSIKKYPNGKSRLFLNF